MLQLNKIFSTLASSSSSSSSTLSSALTPNLLRSTTAAAAAAAAFGFSPKPAQVANICFKQRCPSCTPVYTLRVTNQEDCLRVRRFVSEHFYGDEPLRHGLPSPGLDMSELRFQLQKVRQGTAIIAESPDQDHRIIGAIIGGRKMPRELGHLATSSRLRWAKILKIHARAEKESRVFERFRVAHVFHIYLLAVHRNYRGYGLGARLIREMVKLTMWQKRAEIITMDATSVHAACICKKLGMRLLNTLQYSKHVDRGGNVIFIPPKPHDAMRTYALFL